MKRFHVHMSVTDLNEATTFYARMFGVPPTVQKPDYAKWMLDDPRVNFAISSRGRPAGLDHLGIQAETREELSATFQRMEQAGEVMAQGETTCCYAQSEKSWVHDPQGIPWEAFHTVGESTTYGEGARAAEDHAAACCVPLAPVKKSSRFAMLAEDTACCVPDAEATPGKTGCC
jgi:catechol-2,3-dioxygenase